MQGGGERSSFKFPRCSVILNSSLRGGETVEKRRRRRRGTRRRTRRRRSSKSSKRRRRRKINKCSRNSNMKSEERV